jgi:hypothetical protein
MGMGMVTLLHGTAATIAAWLIVVALLLGVLRGSIAVFR